MRAEITTDVTGHGTLKLDGHDISGFILHGEVGHITTLELDLYLLDVTTAAGEVEVIIPPATAELLERLGWTPPAKS